VRTEQSLEKCPAGLFALIPAGCDCRPDTDSTCELCTDLADAGCVWLAPNATARLTTSAGAVITSEWKTGRCWPGNPFGASQLVTTGSHAPGATGGSCCPSFELDCCRDDLCCPSGDGAIPGFVFLDCCKGGGVDRPSSTITFTLTITPAEWYWGQCKAAYLTYPRKLWASLLIIIVLATVCCACLALCCSAAQGIACLFCFPCYTCIASVMGWRTPAGATARGGDVFVPVGYPISSHIGRVVTVLH